MHKKHRQQRTLQGPVCDQNNLPVFDKREEITQIKGGICICLKDAEFMASVERCVNTNTIEISYKLKFPTVSLQERYLMNYSNSQLSNSGAKDTLYFIMLKIGYNNIKVNRGQ